MSSHDPASGDPAIDDGASSALRVALVELAATMPEDPRLVDRIHSRARRLRSRRRARRATALMVAGGASIATLVAVRAQRSILPAAEPTTVAASTSAAPATPLPSCAEALADLLPAAGTAPTPSASPAPADVAKQAASDAADEANHANTGLRGVKGAGTIVAADPTSVTIGVTAPTSPAQITATIAPTVRYLDGDVVLQAPPPLHPGDPVFFATTQADDGSYALSYLQVHPEAPESAPDATADPAEKANAAGADAGSDEVKGLAEVTAVSSSSITVRLADGPLAGQEVTAATGPDTVFAAGGQKCVEPALAVGMKVSVLLVPADGDSYAARDIGLSRN